MAITVSTTHTTSTAATNTTALAATITASSLVIVTLAYPDNNLNTADSGMTVSGTAMTWTKVTESAPANGSTKTRLLQYAALSNGAGSRTFTHTKGTSVATSRRMSISVIEGAAATIATAIPTGNRIAQTTNTANVSQSITPAGAGSALLGAAGDWNAANAYSALTNNSIGTPFHVAADYTTAFIVPTTNPLASGSAFTWGANCPGGANTWVVVEVVPAAGGGAVFNDSVTEALTATDSESVIATFVAADTEAGTATDSNSAVATFPVARVEAATASDTDSASAVFAASDTEAATATDADGGGYAVAQPEAASATETETAGVVYPVSASEAGSASDTEAAVAVFAVSDTESASASDSAAPGFSDGATESASATDSESATASLVASASEAATATDAPSAGAVYSAAASEVASATDTDTGVATYPVSRTEAATASDSSDGVLGNQTYAVGVTEAASATDTAVGVVVQPTSLQQGGTYRPWRIKTKKEIREEELAELAEFLREVAKAQPLDIPKAPLRGPIQKPLLQSLPFFESPRIAAKAERYDDDEEALLLLIG